MSQGEVLAQDPELAAIVVGAAAAVPQVHRTGLGVLPELGVALGGAGGIGVGEVLLLRGQQIQHRRGGQGLDDRRLAVGTDAAAVLEALPVGVQAHQHHVGGLAQPGQHLLRRLAPGLDKALGDLAGQEDGIAVEAPFPVGLVGEAVLARVQLVVLGDLGIELLGRRTVVPAHARAQTGDGEGHAVVVVGVVDQRVGVDVDEHPPVQAHAQLGQGQRIDSVLQPAGLAQLVQRRQVVVGAPAVIGVVGRQLGDLAEVGEVSRQARVVGRKADQEVDKADRDLARQELVAAVEHRLAVQLQLAAVLDQLDQQLLGLGLDAVTDRDVVGRDGAGRLGRMGGEARAQQHQGRDGNAARDIGNRCQIQVDGPPRVAVFDLLLTVPTRLPATSSIEFGSFLSLLRCAQLDRRGGGGGAHREVGLDRLDEGAALAGVERAADPKRA